jgi:PBP1b-binding outer membrane lipoprotein LpoB
MKQNYLLLIGLIMAVLVISGCTSPEPSNNTDNETTSNETTTTNDLTPDSIKSIVDWDLGDIKNVTIKEDVVTITYDLGFVNDNDYVIFKSSEDAINVLPKLFNDNNRIKSVKLIATEGDTGNDAVRMTVKRSTANRIDWDDANRDLTSNKASFLSLVDSYQIRPGIYKELTLSLPYGMEKT